MNRLAFLVTTLLFSMGAYAGDSADAAGRDKQPISATSDQCPASGEQIVGRGCCSWHGGQCGCSSGRVTCCDATTSPSCLCAKEEPPTGVN